MNGFVTLTTQSQISIPAKYRRLLGFKKGDKLKAEIQGDALVLRPVGDILSLAGSLSHLAKKSLSSQEIQEKEDQAIIRAASERYISTLTSIEKKRLKVLDSRSSAG
ncbi:MAG: AbrB/MazE/SpoVT family DNA-binding domain-containing protein [Patescibacteria group bacterium]